MIVFPINTLENISEQLLLPGNVKKTVLGHQADRKTDQITFFILHIPFFDTVCFGTYRKYLRKDGPAKIFILVLSFLNNGFFIQFLTQHFVK